MSLFLKYCMMAMIAGALAPLSAHAEAADAVSAVGFAESILIWITDAFSAVLFESIFGVPFLVLWLISGALFFTIRLKFVNIRLFCHAFKVIRGKYDNPNDPGDVTHFQAFTSAVSATVGLGNIGGVAVAVSTGGPGAVVWMMIAGFFGMSLKYAEVVLGMKYRHIDEKGRVSGGAFHYLRDGLAKRGLVMPGKILAAIFAVFCITGAIGAGNLFQSNQSVRVLTETFDVQPYIPSAILSILVGLVLLGGIKRIGTIAEKVVPAMAFLYISGSMYVLFVFRDNLGDALATMFSDAWSGAAIGGGLLGVMVKGLQRAAFSNESGLGSAPIAHSASRTTEPVREGTVALLEPLLDTMVICMITGLVITASGVYTTGGGAEGVTLTASAFSSAAPVLQYLITLCVILFAFSTMITWSYYGERAWHYLFGKHSLLMNVYYVIFCVLVFVGGMIPDVTTIVNFADVFLLAMALPNLIGLYIMSGEVAEETSSYIRRFVSNDSQHEQGGK